MTFARILAACIPEEHNNKHAYHVEGSQKGRENRHGKNGQIMFVSDRENRVLAKKPTERRTPDQGQRACSEGEEGDRKVSTKTAHFPDVLFVMKHHDDRARREKEECFEKRVSEKMEHAGRI